MVKATLATLLSAASLSAAFPYIPQLDAAMGERLAALQKREITPAERAPLFVDKRQNTGIPSTTFDAKAQYIDVSDGSEHEWRAPVAGRDTRGQCPGLNAAANHGFLPRSGVTNIQQTIDGLGTLYGLAADTAIFLSVVAIGLNGDPVTNSWSIGSGFANPLGLKTGGIAQTHNKYEGDASIVRGDAYLNGGNVGVFQDHSWNHLYNIAETYGFAQIAKQSDWVTRWSLENNPYYFSAPFSGLVAPAAHNFVIHFMSNHTAEQPGGVLTRDVLKSFFSVTGEPGSFVHNRGMERIPDNWYRRPLNNEHALAAIIPDVLINNAAYPGIVRFGGNTGTTNSFVGIDTGDITGGAMNFDDLAKGNNGACFLLQASLAGMPQGADPLLGAIGSVSNYVTQQFAPLHSKLGCSQLAKFDNQLFNQFPGASFA